MKRVILILLTLLLLPLPTLGYTAESDGYIVRIKENRRFARTAAMDGGIEEIGNGKGLYFAETQEDIAKLSTLGDIEYIEPNYTVTLLALPSDEYYTEQANLHLVNTASMWNVGCYGNDIKIGVIDSGIAQHGDISGNVLDGYNYFDESPDTTDLMGHGTFVSGIIAAQRNDAGIVGAAYRAKIVPLKCFGKAMTTDLKTVVDAIYGAVDDFNCDIINMSFGLSANPVSLSEAVDYAVSKDIIIVAAVGNDGNNTMYYPAAYDNVIGVGSIDNNKNISAFSQRNTSVFVTAPGRDVKSLDLDGGYKTDTGTSHAAPLVAGLLAAAKGIDDNLDIIPTCNLNKTMI